MAEFTNPEQFRSIRQLEIGEDWLPEEIWEDLPLEKIQEDDIDSYNPPQELMTNIPVALQPEEEIEEIRDIGLIKREKNKEKGPSRKQVLTIQKTKSFYKDVIKSYYSFLEEETKTPQGLLLQNKILQPNFSIALNSEVEKTLKKFKMDKSFEKDSILLIFKLPPLLTPPLSEEELFLLENLINNSKGFRQLDTHFTCRRLRKIIWNKLHKNEEEQGMKFRRINNVKEHDPKNYYYVWEVSSVNKRKKGLPHS